MNRVLKIAAHVLCWLVIASIPYIFTPLANNNNVNVKLYTTLLTILGSIIFYLNYGVLIPKLLLRKKKRIYWSYILLISVLFFLIISFLKLILLTNHNFNRANFSFVVYLFLIFLISYVIKISNEWKQTEISKAKLEKEKAAAEILYLKAQINPHFLFNTLNGIYALAVKKSDATPAAVMQLSNMMRYVLYDSDAEKVSMEKEITYIQDYINMQRLRVSPNNQIEYTVVGDTSNTQILPLLFIPFIENAFKYGISTDDETKTIIIVETGQQRVSLYVKNDKKIRADGSFYSGIGIHNVKKRLELGYPNLFVLDIKEEEKEFIVNLAIQL